MLNFKKLFSNSDKRIRTKNDADLIKTKNDADLIKTKVQSLLGCLIKEDAHKNIVSADAELQRMVNSGSIDSSGKIPIGMYYSFRNANVRDMVINHYKELGFQVADVCNYLIFDFNKKNE